MAEFTIRGLRIALASLPAQVLDLPVRAILKATPEPISGQMTLEHSAVVGMAVGQEGLLLFVDQSVDPATTILPILPANERFKTGNPEIDNMTRDEPEDSAGEEWKNG